jgi:hypothetical protein
MFGVIISTVTQLRTNTGFEYVGRRDKIHRSRWLVYQILRTQLGNRFKITEKKILSQSLKLVFVW